MLLAVSALLPAISLGDEVPLFHVTVDVERVDEGSGVVPDDAARADLAGARASLRDEVALALSFDVSPAMRPLRDSGVSRYTWRRNLSYGAASSTRVESGNESGGLLDWDATVERSFPPLACEDLWIHDQVGAGREARSPAPGQGQGPRQPFLRVKLRATWPGKVRVTDDVDGVAAFEVETVPDLEIDRTLPYDLRYAAARKKVSYATALPASDRLPPSSRQWRVELSMAPIEPHSFGLEARPRPDGSVGVRNRIAVGGREVVGLQVRRLQRVWVASEADGLGPPYSLVADWRAVAEDASRTVPPQLSFEPADPGAGLHRRWLVEVLEMVEGLPELGFLYRQVAVETREKGLRYHAAATEGRAISAETWCAIRARSAPATDLPAVAAGGPLSLLAQSDFGSAGIAAR